MKKSYIIVAAHNGWMFVLDVASSREEARKLATRMNRRQASAHPKAPKRKILVCAVVEELS